MKNINIILFFLITSFTGLNAQQKKSLDFEKELERLVEVYPKLNDNILIDISGLNLYETLSTIADEYRINMSVDPKLNFQIVSNFYDIPIKEVLLFLAKKYDLEVSMVKNIIIFKEKKIIKITKKEEPVKIFDIQFKKQNGFLSVNLRNDPLNEVSKKITDLTNQNIIVPADLQEFKVSSYIKNRPFDQVLNMIAKSNKLGLSKDENDFYYFEKITQQKNKKRNKNKKEQTNTKLVTKDIVTTTDDGFLNVKVEDVSVYEIIKDAAEKLNINYFIYDLRKSFRSYV